METQLKIIGVILLLLTTVHIAFPRYFEWKENLQALSMINRQMMQTHTFFIALTLLLMGLLCFFCSHDLVSTALGKTLCAGMAFFWAARLFFQFFVYSPKLWRGKLFETIIHILFVSLWFYFSGVFFSISYFGN